MHQGCDMQILLFDSEPHNILLDENFTLKVSDFRLANFYRTDDSTVSVTAVKEQVGDLRALASKQGYLQRTLAGKQGQGDASLQCVECMDLVSNSLKDQQPEHCGYPGFELTCKDGDTILRLPSVGELLVLTSRIQNRAYPLRKNALLISSLVINLCVFQHFLALHPHLLLHSITFHCLCMCRSKHTLVLIVATVVSSKVYKSWILANKKGREDQLKIEKFLEDYKSLKPTRYFYSEIKKMTNQFKCKLGQGGYGSVFNGALSNGVLVAVKILKEPASDGDDFTNEVGTIGWIHHVNVVCLLGLRRQMFAVLGCCCLKRWKEGHRCLSGALQPSILSEWIYDFLHQGEELGLRIVAEEDAKIARLLTFVATWCIQWYPSGRPSMKTVIRVSEGELDNLAMPPNPFVSTAPGGEAKAAVLEGLEGPNIAVITE
ncbi:hypothetical protein NE237_027954 [Protea cynaroides]|uniref:Serine-threonine/tyrosine-protein kinase catalytic domain-containing protein n=1 Tax=Protea cynaroides TaxID=273540 RepID=A0A9Q0JTM9_9MAGN|nr:hypothetical protein NE237_027954 [Protea cynaroides]